MNTVEKPIPLEIITWQDIRDANPTWDSIKNWIEWGKEGIEKGYAVVTQPGYIVYETKDYLLMSNQVLDAGTDRNVELGNCTTIPKGCILKREILGNYQIQVRYELE